MWDQAGKQKGSKAKASRPKSAKQTPANRSRPALAKIGMTPAYEEDDEGVRRSTRNRLTPCKYWKNERVEYEKQPGGLFKVVTKVKPETPPVKPRAQSKRKLGGRQDERKRPRTIPEEDEYKEDLPDVPDTEPIMVGLPPRLTAALGLCCVAAACAVVSFGCGLRVGSLNVSLLSALSGCGSCCSLSRGAISQCGRACWRKGSVPGSLALTATALPRPTGARLVG